MVYNIIMRFEAFPNPLERKPLSFETPEYTIMRLSAAFIRFAREYIENVTYLENNNKTDKNWSDNRPITIQSKDIFIRFYHQPQESDDTASYYVHLLKISSDNLPARLINIRANRAGEIISILHLNLTLDEILDLLNQGISKLNSIIAKSSLEIQTDDPELTDIISELTHMIKHTPPDKIPDLNRQILESPFLPPCIVKPDEISVLINDSMLHISTDDSSCKLFAPPEFLQKLSKKEHTNSIIEEFKNKLKRLLSTITRNFIANMQGREETSTDTEKPTQSFHIFIEEKLQELVRLIRQAKKQPILPDGVSIQINELLQEIVITRGDLMILIDKQSGQVSIFHREDQTAYLQPEDINEAPKDVKSSVIDLIADLSSAYKQI